MTTFVFVPGYGNSLGDHWQLRWYDAALAAGERAVWVEQPDWEGPDPEVWVASLAAVLDDVLPDAAGLDAAGAAGAGAAGTADAGEQGAVVLVAHSLGVLTVVRWASRRPDRAGLIAGALLVAAPDPGAAAFPAQLPWGPPELDALPFASCLVTSDDDPYASVERSASFAAAWGARQVSLGAAGHVNAAAGFGDWPQGPRLLAELLDGRGIPT